MKGLRRVCSSDEDTQALGATLARSLPDPGALQVVHLYGDLGSGKTTLVRGLLRQLGHEGAVRSPTYTLFETYNAGQCTVLHADLYRLQDPQELENLGIRDFAAPGYLWLVEWPQKGEGLLPPADLRLELTVADGAHIAQLCGVTQVGIRWLQNAGLT